MTLFNMSIIYKNLRPAELINLKGVELALFMSYHTALLCFKCFVNEPDKFFTGTKFVIEKDYRRNKIFKMCVKWIFNIYKFFCGMLNKFV